MLGDSITDEAIHMTELVTLDLDERRASARAWGAELLETDQDSDSSEDESDDEQDNMTTPSFRFSHLTRSEFDINSLCGLKESNPIRSFCIDLYLHRYFSKAVLLLVLLNTICLAFVDPLEPSTTVRNEILHLLEIVFNVLFTLEALIKMTATGSRAYLKDPWNRMDLLIILSSWISVVSSFFENQDSEMINFSVFRAVRVLKVLRTVHGLKGIRTLVVSLLDALKMLIHVISLLIFLFFVFGIMGLQLFQGSFHQICYPYQVEDPFYQNAPRCSANGRQCPTNFTCTTHDPITNALHPNPNFNIISFDNIFSSFLTIFQCISLEGWVDVMYWTFESKSKYSVIYFVTLISLGALFIINLVVAVIHDAYERKFKQVQRRIIQSKISFSKKKKHDNLIKLSAHDMLSGPEMNMLLNRFQTPDTVSIDYTNFIAYANPGQRILRARQQLRSYLTRAASRSVDSKVIFRTLDANGDGEIDEAELHQGLSKLMIPMDPDSLSAVFHYLDSDGSGGISIQEFFAFAAPPSEEQEILEYKLKLGLMAYKNDPPFLQHDIKQTGCVTVKDFKLVLAEIGLTTLRSSSRRITTESSKWTFITQHPWFSRTINLLILANTLVLAMQHHEMDETWACGLAISNTTFTIIFAIEMVLKWMGMGIFPYLQDPYNVFDMAIVVAGLAELAFSTALNMSVLRTFRLFRVFRVLKLMRYWKNLKILLETILRSWKGLANFSVLLGLMIYIYALCGMDFYGGKFTPTTGFDQVPRANFDSLPMSFLTVFLVLSGENWNEVMYDCMRVNGLIGTIFIVSMFFIGNYIMLNLFLAILLQNFESAENESNISYYQCVGQESEWMTAVFKRCWGKRGAAGKRKTIKVAKKNENSKITPQVSSDHIHLHDLADQMMLQLESKSYRKGFKTFHGCIATAQAKAYLIESQQPVEILEQLATLVHRIEPIADDHNAFDLEKTEYFCLLPRPNRSSVQESIQQATAEAKQLKINQRQKKELKKAKVLTGTSLGVFSSTNRVRKTLTNILLSQYFEYFTLCTIALSTIVAAIDSPTASTELKTILWYCDFVLTLFFTMEMCMKIISRGLTSYLCNGWNIVDCTVVCCSLLQLLIQDSQLGALKAIRSVRALRPLRVVSRNSGMKIVVNALFKAMPSILNVFVVILIFFLIFGIMGVDLFAGKFHFCSGLEQDKWNLNRTMCIGTVQLNDGTIMEREWIRPSYHFDNIFNAMLVLFEMSTLEMWPSVLMSGIDVSEIDAAPIREYSLIYAIFFVAFITICAFFIMSLFLGIVIFKFEEIKEEENGSLFLTDDQRKWVAAQRRILSSKPYYIPTLAPESSKFKRKMFEIATHPTFDVGIMVCIFINIITMAMSYYNQPQVYTDTLHVFQIAFSSIFALEALIKLIGLGPTQYFHSRWNCFDFFIVLSSVIMDYFNIDLMVFRAFRVMRLLKSSQGMMSIMKTVLTSLPSLFNVGSLMVLLYFVFAILGMNIFGEITTGNCVNDIVNFRSVPYAILTLLRSSTGESWNCLMHDYMETAPILAPIYFILFNILGSFIVLNLLIAVILENFSDYMETQNATTNAALKQSHLDEFQHVWGELAGQGNLFMDSYYLVRLLRTLSPPLGIRGMAFSDARMLLHIRKLDILQDQSARVFYLDVFHSLCRNALPDAYCNFDCSKIEQQFNIRMGDIALRNFKAMKDVETQHMTPVDLSQAFNAATGLQSIWRAHHSRLHAVVTSIHNQIKS